MQINIPDPISQTTFFGALFLLAIFLSIKKKPSETKLSVDSTNELKGIAMLMVIFSHLGYFLSTDNRFLFPLSVAGGVGVNLFLFLSGYGLTISALSNNYSIGQFYLKRLMRIYLPLWVSLLVILILDYFLLGKSYSALVVRSSFLGFFPNTDIFSSINSPLWYVTLVLFYYLIFPLLFFRKFPFLSILLIITISKFILNLELPVEKDILKLYNLHYLAFPLGIVFAIVAQTNFFKQLINKIPNLVKIILIIFLLIIFGFTAIHSGVGEGIKIEQQISLITMGSVVLIILLSRVKSELLILLGLYSYEIYLLHWPILYRYDFLYKNIPTFLATLLYLLLFIILGFLLNKLVKLIISFFGNRLISD